MAKPSIRVEIKKKPDFLIGIAERIINKHDSDGENSVLNVINMPDMKQKTVEAREKNSLAYKNSRSKEIAFEARDISLGIKSGNAVSLNYYVKASRNILLGIYKGKEHLLGDHGFEVSKNTGGVKIVVPANASKLIDLAGRILEKHTTDGANSAIIWLNIADFTSKFRNIIFLISSILV